MTTILRKYWRC